MTPLHVEWDADLWRWTLAPSTTPADTDVAVAHSAGLRTLVDGRTGQLREISIDAIDPSGSLDTATTRAALALLGRADFAHGQRVLVDPIRVVAFASHGGTDRGDSEVGMPATAQVDDDAGHVIDQTSMRSTIGPGGRSIVTTADVRPGTYAPAVRSLRVALVDPAADLVLGITSMRLEPGPRGPIAVAVLIVAPEPPLATLELRCYQVAG